MLEKFVLLEFQGILYVGTATFLSYIVNLLQIKGYIRTIRVIP